MRDVGLYMVEMERIYGFYPQVQYLGFSNRDEAGQVPTLRTTRNFALIFEDGLEQACYLVDGKRFACRTPAMVCIEPYRHSYRQANDGPCKKFYFSYSGTETFFNGRWKERELPVLSPIVMTELMRKLTYEILTIANSWHVADMADRVDALCANLLLEMLQARQDMNGAQQPKADSEKLSDVAEYIRSHCAENLDFGDLARHSGMSQRTFLRHWQKQFGGAPKRYQLQCRLELGKRYLLESELSLNAIAKLTGCSDQFAFSKLFHRIVGCWPSAFRRGGGKDSRR